MCLHIKLLLPTLKVQTVYNTVDYNICAIFVVLFKYNNNSLNSQIIKIDTSIIGMFFSFKKFEPLLEWFDIIQTN